MARRKSFVAKLFTHKKKKRKRSTAATQSRRQNNGWRYTSDVPSIQRPPLRDVKPFEVPKGPCSASTYIYDGRPLKGTRKGSKFLLDVVRGQQAMTSVYTKTHWISTYAIAYKGQLIGFINDTDRYADLTKRLLDQHERVVIHAERLGTDSGGWPIIKLMLPYRSWFDSQLTEARHDIRDSSGIDDVRATLLWLLKSVCNQKSRNEYLHTQQ